jgi:cytochrome c5
MNRQFAIIPLIAGLALAFGDNAAQAEDSRARTIYNQVCFNCHGTVSKFGD